MPHGLPRKIRIAFILQAVLASLGILLGAWLVSLVIKHSLVGAALREEAAYYWTLHEASPAATAQHPEHPRLPAGKRAVGAVVAGQPAQPGTRFPRAAQG